MAGREGQGIVRDEEASEIKAVIARQLAGIADPLDGRIAVHSVKDRIQIYSGPYAAKAPDLLVNFAPGYRVSWSTPLGGMGKDLFEDNTKKWAGDHMLAPDFVPGVLFANRSIRSCSAGIEDLAPTILAMLGVPKGSVMEGNSLL
jgi:predicted AlkP superfamily phosphohydrolase/phosphomutase